MTEVDPLDDSIVRYVIRRHQYDPETKHFRWFYESAYDNKRQYGKRLQDAFDELAMRRLGGGVHIKEHLSGQRLEVGYFSNSKLRRERQREQGTLRSVNWKRRILFMFFSITHRLPRRMHKR